MAGEAQTRPSPLAEERFAAMKARLAALDGVLVAFSGGVDSSVLLAGAMEALGRDRVLAVTARSPSMPGEEERSAADLAAAMGARHITIETHEIDDPEYRNNPTHRCFVCKSTLFSSLASLAGEHGLEVVAEGSNADDEGDFRPGMRAAQALGVIAPLRDARLTKDQIRQVARARDIAVWDKPSAACLASRVPYGSEITREKLARIGQAEHALRALGFGQLRVRDHGTVARIELDPTEIPRLLDDRLRDQVLGQVRAAGYRYVSVDLQGYRTGSMNEVITRPGS